MLSSRFLLGAPLAVALALLTGCVSEPSHPRIAYTGDPVIDGKAQRALAPARDRVMWDYRIAASALRLGRLDEAKAQLDDAILSMGGIIANSAEARRARSMFSAESNKLFIGEPYERVMAYYYRGILYWHDGEPDNARACFRSAQFIDSGAELESHRSDYVLLEYLDGLATTKLGDDGSDAFARAQKNAKLELPGYDRSANVLCFVEFGRGPRKYAGGEYGEQLRFLTAPSQARAAVLTVAGQDTHFAPWDDLNFQATTRGGRVMDHILGNKAVFKQGAETFGDVALAGSAVAASRVRREDGTKSEGSQETAIALGAVGVLSKIASAATATQADTRQWDNLPQSLSFAALTLPPGEHVARLAFFDAESRLLPNLTRSFTIYVADQQRDTVVFLSEHKR